MTKKELKKRLKHAGFFKHTRGKHDIWTKIGLTPIPVPRHKGIFQ